MEEAWNNHKHKTYHMVAHDGLSDARNRAERSEESDVMKALEGFTKHRKPLR